MVWKELGVRNLADLERAAAGGRLRTLSGFTAKTEAAVLESIAAARRRRERTPVAVALPYAEALARMLRKVDGFERLEIAGSLRRLQDLVGDIDLLGAAQDPGGALNLWVVHQFWGLRPAVSKKMRSRSAWRRRAPARSSGVFTASRGMSMMSR